MSRDTLRRAAPVVRWVLIADAALTGPGYVLGPVQWSAGGTLSTLRELPVPVPVWGAAFCAVALLLLARQRLAGHSLGAVLYLAWGASAAWTIYTGQISGWGGPWHLLALASLHLMCLWVRATERQMAAPRNEGAASDIDPFRSGTARRGAHVVGDRVPRRRVPGSGADGAAAETR